MNFSRLFYLRLAYNSFEWYATTQRKMLDSKIVYDILSPQILINGARIFHDTIIFD